MPCNKSLHFDNTFPRTICVSTSDAIGLVDKKSVTKVQTKYLDILRRYITITFPEDKGRFGKILLRLPTLRTLSAKAAERFLSLTLEGVLPLNDLVQEMMCWNVEKVTPAHWGPFHRHFSCNMKSCGQTFKYFMELKTGEITLLYRVSVLTETIKGSSKGYSLNCSLSLYVVWI